MGITLLWTTAPPQRFAGWRWIGCVFVYLLKYALELNPVEFVFNKSKAIPHRVDYRNLLRDNLHVAVYKAIKQFTASYMHGFYKHLNYIRLIENL